jgi:hypothetical protein
LEDSIFDFLPTVQHLQVGVKVLIKLLGMFAFGSTMEVRLVALLGGREQSEL